MSKLDKNRLITVFTVVFCLTGMAAAGRIAIYIDDSEGNIKAKCRDFTEGATAYEVLASDPDFTINDFGWGYGVCKVIGKGCPADDCFCDPNFEFWNFLSHEGSWSMPPVGIGDHELTDGQIIGFKWGQWGDKPSEASFADICPQKSKGKTIIPKYIGLAVGHPGKDNTVKVNVTDNKTGRPLRRALIEVYDGTPGWTGSFLQVKTGDDGTAEIEVPAEGEYGVRVTALKYHHKYDTINIVKTTSTTTSTVTTTSTTGTTTTTLKHIIREPIKKTTTTLKPTTTLDAPKVTSNAVSPARIQPQEKSMLDEIWGWLFG
ncbi:carboxypeptidase-like regulatory domain-containing protein [Candidatus Altiarchaeota archaeon]